MSVLQYSCWAEMMRILFLSIEAIDETNNLKHAVVDLVFEKGKVDTIVGKEVNRLKIAD